MGQIDCELGRRANILGLGYGANRLGTGQWDWKIGGWGVGLIYCALGSRAKLLMARE